MNEESTAKLVAALEVSDVAFIASMRDAIGSADDPWALHRALYPPVDRVLNPPFINPHLPKMYAICRDFVPYLTKDIASALVYLELVEYTRRPKLERVPEPSHPGPAVGPGDIAKALKSKDRDRAASLMAAYLRTDGGTALLRYLLLLGSGSMGQSIGHSLSCTSFILLELIERPDADHWPACLLLSDYFCNGGFADRPVPTDRDSTFPPRDVLSRAVTGTGFIDLHHTITLYAIERVKSFLTPEEHSRLLSAWAAFIGDKPSRLQSFPSPRRLDDYDDFFECFSALDPNLVVERIGGMTAAPDDRFRLCRFLIAGVCALYQGEYDPHFLTGLGSLVWMINTYHDDTDIVLSALFQYLGFLFRGLKSRG